MGIGVCVLTRMCLLLQMSVSSESTEEVAARGLYGADPEKDMAGMTLDKPVENARRCRSWRKTSTTPPTR